MPHAVAALYLPLCSEYYFKYQTNHPHFMQVGKHPSFLNSKRMFMNEF